MRRAIETIRVELKGRLEELSQQGKLLERQRLEQRTMYDLESIEQMGFCSGNRELLAPPHRAPRR